MSAILYDIYLIALLAATINGCFNFKKLDYGLKSLCILIFLTLIQETTIKFFLTDIAIKYTCYHIYSVLELSVISLLFVKCISEKWIGFKVALLILIWLIAGTVNIRYFQKLTMLNSNMILLESFVITAMSMIALYKMLLNEHMIDIFRQPYFVIWSILLIYWSASYFYWAFVEILYKNNWHFPVIDIAQTLLNIAEYAIIGFAFSIRPKWIESWA